MLQTRIYDKLKPHTNSPELHKKHYFRENFQIKAISYICAVSLSSLEKCCEALSTNTKKKLCRQQKVFFIIQNKATSKTFKKSEFFYLQRSLNHSILIAENIVYRRSNNFLVDSRWN